MFYQLRVELVFLYGKWTEFVHLFGEGEQTINLINRHGPHFFWVVQEALVENIILHVARLTDSARMKGDENLSIPLLIELIPDPMVKAKAQELEKLCHEKAEISRQHRNKRIAHRDLSHALKSTPKPLSGISRKQIGEMLEAFDGLLSYLHTHYFGSTYFFKGLGANGARTLIYSLKEYERLKEKEEGALRGAL